MQIEDELLERIQKHCESIEECNNTSPKTNLNVPLSTAEVRFLLSTIEGLKGEVTRTHDKLAAEAKTSAYLREEVEGCLETIGTQKKQVETYRTALKRIELLIEAANPGFVEKCWSTASKALEVSHETP